MNARIDQRKASEAFSKSYKGKYETKLNQNIVKLMNASTSIRFLIPSAVSNIKDIFRDPERLLRYLASTNVDCIICFARPFLKQSHRPHQHHEQQQYVAQKLMIKS